MNINNGDNQLAYNNGNDIPYVASKIFDFLISDNLEVTNKFWKILKYADYDCLEKDNLTKSERRKIIYTHGGIMNDYNVFLNAPLVNVEQIENKSMIKVYKVRTKPNTRMEFILSYAFEIIVGSNIINMSDGDDMVSRVDMLESCLISSLHGRDFGFGKILFDIGLSRDCQAYTDINNGKGYNGETLVFAIRNVRTDVGGTCE